MKLHNITLDNSSVQDYLFKICTIVDAITSIGNLISTSHHIDVILEGLHADYTPIVFVVESNFGVMNFD